MIESSQVNPAPWFLAHKHRKSRSITLSSNVRQQSPQPKASPAPLARSPLLSRCRQVIHIYSVYRLWVS